MSRRQPLLRAATAQRGAALAIALLMLLIITLLGVAAVRATRTELKLAGNAESRMAATQSAESLVAYANTITSAMPVNGVADYLTCMRGAEVAGSNTFACASNDSAVVPGESALSQYGYLEVRREKPLFVEVDVLRDNTESAGLSAKNYDFARFTVTGGFDRSEEGRSAAEVIEGTLKLHTKVDGVNYE